MHSVHSVFGSTALNKSSFQNCRLYVIVDRSAIAGRDPAAVAEAAIRGGADVIQWRDKQASDVNFLAVARRLRELTQRTGTIFVVNDRVTVAQIVQADGVHLGHEDLPVQEVRSLVGSRMLIGRSIHSLKEAQEAQAAGADYLGVGPVCATPTKPDYPVVGLDLIRQIKPVIRIPWVAIGGIDLQLLPLVLSAGATRIAVVRAVAGASDVEGAARALKQKMT